MKSIFFHKSSIVLLLLGLATAISWFVSEFAKDGATNASFVTASILMVVTFIKVKMVVSYFMEVRHAPLALKLACDSWLFVSCAIILGMYWLTDTGMLPA